MLSRMLQMHPQVLSLSEFWNVFLSPEVHFPVHDMNGEEFWQQIAKPNPDNDGLDLVGMYPAGRGRFDPAAGVPSICRVLAPLTDDPNAPYDRLAFEVPSWPRRPMAAHCRALFACLTEIFGCTTVVERSGGSVLLTELLCQQFPEARFVFLHRDGPDSALSMSRFPVFRLGVMREVADAVSDPRSSLPAEMLPAEIRTAAPEDFKGLICPPFDRERFMAYPLPLTIFGAVWSTMTCTGTSEIRTVPCHRRTTMRYERIIADTRAELSRLADFIGVPADRQWLDRAGQFIDPARRGRAAARLHPSALAELRAACAAGTRAFDLLESEHAVPAGAASGI